MAVPDSSSSPTGQDHPLPPGQKARPDLPVRHYGPIPRRKPDPWPIAVGGKLADRTLTTSVAELVDVTLTGQTADLHCASGWSCLDLEWEGVPASRLLDMAPPPAGVTDVLVYGEYGYSANVTIEDLRSPQAMIATGLNGVPLSSEHGAPVRLVLPHLYCWKGPKWFRGWDYVTPDTLGFWEARGYHRVGNCWLEQRHTLPGPPKEDLI